MKIAVLVQKFPNSSETFIVNQIVGMIDRKYEVHVYADVGEDSLETSKEIEKYGLRGKVFYFSHGRWKIPHKMVIRFVKACRILGELRALNPWNLLRSLNVSRYGRNAANLSLFYQAAALMKNGPYDIVHCHFGPTGKIGAMLKDLGIIRGKVITTFHGYDISSYIQKNGSGIYDFLFAQGDIFIVISENMKDRLIRLGCEKRKIVINRIGVNLSRFHFLPREQTNGSKLNILTVGRFIEKKGLEYGIRAVSQLVGEFPGMVYRIIGDGELRDEITQLIIKLNVEKHIQLLGWKTPDEVAKFMGEADVFLAPSVTSRNGDQEGTPTVIIEALARGLPVISTFHSGIPELIQNGKSGFLVPERNAESIAQKLQYLYQHPEKRGELGQNGRDWVERYHDINKLNDQLAHLYEQECKKFF